MPKIIGLAGSVRRGSFNAALLEAARELAPKDLEIEIASIRDIPLYDADLEKDKGVPEVVESLKDRIAGSDGLLLVSPEYNASIPGRFKNAIDWLSRPAKDIARVFGDKPVGLMGATPGRGGTTLAQAAWLPVLHALNARVWFGPRVYVAGAGAVFDAEGKMIDEKVRALVGKYLEGYAKFVAETAGRG